MRHFLLTLFLLVTLLPSATAQTVLDEITAHPEWSGNQSRVYPGAPDVALTPTPQGYLPFYMSHYGRHGSRYNWGYADPVKTLQKAHDLGKLTPLGEQTLQQLRQLAAEAYMREGELTQLGAEQHRGIAERMYRNFPEIFASPVATIEARSTIVIRCILSMENALQQLSGLNPQLTIRHDASEHDMYFMNYSDHSYDSLRHAAHKVHRQFTEAQTHPERLMRTLFNDDRYWQDSLSAPALMRQLHTLAAHTQNTELRRQIDLLPLFTPQENYDLWQIGNASWYIDHASSPLTEGRAPYSERNLLRRIIADADSCLQLDHPNASLRYGHDGNVMPLTCLLGLDGLDVQYSIEELAARGWCDYKIIPMACNIQMIFYKPTTTRGGEILVKVLRNEAEAHLPIPTDQWPYYRWSDVRAYYLDKLE